jgi:hypothetical protein
MESATEITAPEDASPRGHFLELLEAFCTDRFQAQNMGEIFFGKPFTGNDGRTYFRLRDVMTYLERHRVREFSRNKVVTLLKEIPDAEYAFRKVHEKGVNLWSVPQFAKEEPFPVSASVLNDEGGF